VVAVTRLALVRVPDGTPDPAGLIGWYTTRAPRRYAYVADRNAWHRWVLTHYPENACVHIDPVFERNVRDQCAAAGYWTTPGPGPDNVTRTMPDGMKVGTDGSVRLAVTGSASGDVLWESPLDITEEAPA
jgi:hypothetical protein